MHEKRKKQGRVKNAVGIGQHQVYAANDFVGGATTSEAVLSTLDIAKGMTQQLGTNILQESYTRQEFEGRD